MDGSLVIIGLALVNGVMKTRGWAFPSRNFHTISDWWFSFVTLSKQDQNANPNKIVTPAGLSILDLSAS